MHTRFIAFLAVLTVTGCGGTKEGPDGRVDPLTTSEGICELWGLAACNEDVVRDCNGSSGTQKECALEQADFCETKLGRHVTGLDRDTAQECLDEVESAYEDSEITYDEFRKVVDVSTGPCRQLVDQGGAGGAGNAGGGLLDGGDDCAPPKPGKADPCVETHYCDADRMYCRPKADPGEICCEIEDGLIGPTCSPDDPEIPCVTSAYCAQDGVCVARGDEGAECSTDRECAVGFLCVTGIGECRDFITLGTGTSLCGDLGSN